MDQPSTSTRVGDDKTYLSPKNIGPMTAKIIERIIWMLKEEQTSNNQSIPPGEPVARTARYTGMNRVIIEKLLAVGDTMEYEHEYELVDRQIIHKCLTNMYLSKNHIPTITELYFELNPTFIDLDHFTKILIKMGYVFYKLPGTQSLRVMEKKAVTFDRYKYIKSILRYRKDLKPIVYVGLVSITNQMKVLNLERTLHMDLKNISRHILFTVTVDEISNIKSIAPSKQEVLQDIVKKWLLSIFNLQNLTPGSVCVLEDSKIFRETLIDVPTWKSVKVDMVEWLEEHNIPCHIDMPKADLLHLIETCTDTNENTFVIDNFAKQHGYVIMRLPQCINGLSTVPLIVDFLNSRQNYLWNMGFEKVFKKISPTLLKSFSNSVEEEEAEQLFNDNKVDEVLDDLVKNVQNLHVEDNEDDTTLVLYSDSE